jgi:hypothetical protein
MISWLEFYPQKFTDLHKKERIFNIHLHITLYYVWKLTYLLANGRTLFHQTLTLPIYTINLMNHS